MDLFHADTLPDAITFEIYFQIIMILLIYLNSGPMFKIIVKNTTIYKISQNVREINHYIQTF